MYGSAWSFQCSNLWTSLPAVIHHQFLIAHFVSATLFHNKTKLSFFLQPHLRSSTPALGLCRRTCTSRWPEHPAGLQRLSSHNAGSQRQTELCASPTPEQSPGWTAALIWAGRITTWKINCETEAHMPHYSHTSFLKYWIDKNLNRLVKSLLLNSLSVFTLSLQVTTAANHDLQCTVWLQETRWWKVSSSNWAKNQLRFKI